MGYAKWFAILNTLIICEWGVCAIGFCTWAKNVARFWNVISFAKVRCFFEIWEHCALLFGILRPQVFKCRKGGLLILRLELANSVHESCFSNNFGHFGGMTFRCNDFRNIGCGDIDSLTTLFRKQRVWLEHIKFNEMKWFDFVCIRIQKHG
jgi:hypothetical protein